MRRLGIVCAIVLCSVLVASAAVRVPDPGQKGPFEVGFTTYMIFDGSRDGGDDFPEGRPIPVFVWYPVDPDSISQAVPLAEYPLDPLYGYLPTSSSDYWEAEGLGRAYQ